MKKAIILILLLTASASAQIEQHPGFPVNVGDELQSPLAVQDINRDGTLEILAAPENRMIKVYTSTGALMWENTGGRVQYDTGRTPLATDLSGDSRLEILTYGNPGMSDATIYIWDSTGIKLTEFLVGKYLIISPPSITKDRTILTGAAPGKALEPITQYSGVHAFAPSGNRLWYLELGSSVNFQASIPVDDIDADGHDEAVILTQDINSAYPSDGKIWLIKADQVLWSMDLGGDARGAVIADLNRDGTKEIAAVSSGGVYIIDRNGSLLQKFDIKGNRHAPSAGDLDGDGINELVIASSEENRIYIISNGAVKQFYAEKVSSNLALGDINNDGKLEIAAGDLYGNMYVWDYNGNVLETRTLERKYHYFTSALIADLEGDGSKEIILGNKNGNIHVWKAKNPVPPVAIISSPADGSVYQLNSSVEFISSSTDDRAIASYRWESDMDGIIGDTASFTRVLSAGRHNITLTVTDNDGLSNSTGVMIKVNKPPVAFIESPQDGTIYKQKDTVIFNGTGTDEDGFITSYQWTSDIDGILSGERSFTSSNLSTGVHNITLGVTDNDGATGSYTVRITQKGYRVNWDLKYKQLVGDASLLGNVGSGNVNKLGNMMPIRFTVSEDGNIVIDTSVRVIVFDPAGSEVWSAGYGSAVRMSEGKYIANFKSKRTDPPGLYRFEVRFDGQRRNQDFSAAVYLLSQKGASFAGMPVNLKTNSAGLTYEWRLGERLIGSGRELAWVPDSPGVYCIQLVVMKNGNKVDTENYAVVVNAEADANGDDVVNVLDLSLLGLNWGKADFDDSADVNGDGVVDILDAVRIGKKWG